MPHLALVNATFAKWAALTLTLSHGAREPLLLPRPVGEGQGEGSNKGHCNIIFTLKKCRRLLTQFPASRVVMNETY